MLFHLLGTAASKVWAVGLLAAGQSSTMTGTYAGQFVMEGFLNLKIAPWKRVALTRSVALVPAILVALLARGSSSGDTLDEWLNILQSIQLPFALLPVLHFSSSHTLMKEFTNHIYVNTAVWLVAVGVIVVNFYLVLSSVLSDDTGIPQTWYVYVLLSILLLLYILALYAVIEKDLKHFISYLRALKQHRSTTYMKNISRMYDVKEGGLTGVIEDMEYDDNSGEEEMSPQLIASSISSSSSIDTTSLRLTHDVHTSDDSEMYEYEDTGMEVGGGGINSSSQLHRYSAVHITKSEY